MRQGSTAQAHPQIRKAVCIIARRVYGDGSRYALCSMMYIQSSTDSAREKSTVTAGTTASLQPTLDLGPETVAKAGSVEEYESRAL